MTFTSRLIRHSTIGVCEKVVDVGDICIKYTVCAQMKQHDGESNQQNKTSRALREENEKLQSELVKVKAQLHEAREHVQDQIMATQLGNEFFESSSSIDSSDSESTTELQRSLHHTGNTSIEGEMKEFVKAQLGMIQYEMERMIKEKNRDTLSLRRNISKLKKQREILSVVHANEIRRVRSSLTKPENNVKISGFTGAKDKVLVSFTLNSLMMLILGFLTIPVIHRTTAWVQDGAYITDFLNPITQRLGLEIINWNGIVIDRSTFNKEREEVQNRIVKLQAEIQNKQLAIDALESALRAQKSEKEAMIAEAKWANAFSNVSIGFYCAMMTMVVMKYVSRRKVRRPEHPWDYSYASDVHGSIRKGAGIVEGYLNKWTNRSNRYPSFRFIFIVGVLCVLNNL